ncbi:hypothetical protein K438DRAFT_1776590 [Mycena galopus ATCC 62051]|nr:hypothetical protein K438DRAFT_1776590 [Mycena galopus ATCC 62051]
MTEQGDKRPKPHAKGDAQENLVSEPGNLLLQSPWFPGPRSEVAQNPPWSADSAVAIASPKYDDNSTRGAEQPLGYHSGVSEILQECQEKIGVSKEAFRRWIGCRVAQTPRQVQYLEKAEKKTARISILTQNHSGAPPQSGAPQSTRFVVQRLAELRLLVVFEMVVVVGG